MIVVTGMLGPGYEGLQVCIYCRDKTDMTFRWVSYLPVAYRGVMTLTNRADKVRQEGTLTMPCSYGRANIGPVWAIGCTRFVMWWDVDLWYSDVSARGSNWTLIFSPSVVHPNEEGRGGSLWCPLLTCCLSEG